LAKTQLKQEIELRILHQTGGFRGQAFNGVVEIHNSANIRHRAMDVCTKQGVFDARQFTGVIGIYTRATPVAMATKIGEF